jgi:hypothetical protein
VATVYKRNSTYWVRFQWRGKEVRRSAHTTSKATAQQFLAGLLESIGVSTVVGIPAEPTRKHWNGSCTIICQP